MQDAYHDHDAAEWVIPLANGYQIRSGWVDHDDPEALPAGDYFRVVDRAGAEVFYEDSADILADPIEGRRKFWALIQACAIGVPPRGL